MLLKIAIALVISLIEIILSLKQYFPGENHPKTKAVLSWLELAREQAKEASLK